MQKEKCKEEKRKGREVEGLGHGLRWRRMKEKENRKREGSVKRRNELNEKGRLERK